MANAINCGDVIGPNQTAKLTANLTCSTDPALTVIGSATLDLNGFTVSCSPPANVFSKGILLDGEQAVLKKGTVSGCHHGVSAEGSGKHKIEQITVKDSAPALEEGSAVGFLFWNNANQCIRCTAQNINGEGYLILNEGANNTFIQSQSIANYGDDILSIGVGFWITFGSKNNRLINCIAKDNDAAGFMVSDTGNSFVSSSAIGNGWETNVFPKSGFILESSSGNTRLNGIIANNNGGSGIEIISDNNTLIDVKANNNTDHGIVLSILDFGPVVFTPENNRVVRAKAQGNGDLDLRDDTNCATNIWVNVVADTKSDCIP